MVHVNLYVYTNLIIDRLQRILFCGHRVLKSRHNHVANLPLWLSIRRVLFIL